MQVPAPLPDLLAPQLTRREVQAVTPASAVPGVEAIAETLDSRVALQWTQPVLAGQPSDSTRASLAQLALQASSNPKSLPQGSSDTASTAMQWSQTPVLLKSLLDRVMSQNPQTGIAWPKPAAPSEMTAATINSDRAGAVAQALQLQYDALQRSALFASDHLANHWFRKPNPGRSPVHASEGVSHEQVLQWIQALAPDSEPALQVAQALMSGRMDWQGELLPGLMVHMQREDAWREDPAQPGVAEKGAALHVRIDLPQLGRLQVTAYQWGAHLELSVQFPSQGKSQLEEAWPTLQSRLASQDLGEVHSQWNVEE